MIPVAITDHLYFLQLDENIKILLQRLGVDDKPKDNDGSPQDEAEKKCNCQEMIFSTLAINCRHIYRYDRTLLLCLATTCLMSWRVMFLFLLFSHG